MLSIHHSFDESFAATARTADEPHARLFHNFRFDGTNRSQGGDVEGNCGTSLMISASVPTGSTATAFG